MVQALFDLNSFCRLISVLTGGLLVTLLGTPSTVVATTSLKESIVKLYTVFNEPHYHEPWSMKGQRTRHGSGSIISGHRILTNAHIVSDQMFIQVRRGGQAKKYTAEVEAVSHEADLAIVRVEDEDFFSNTIPLEIGNLPDLKDTVSVYGFPDGGDKFSMTEGIVSRIEHIKYAHSGAFLLSGQVDASINSGNSGGPVIKDGKIVGVAFQSLRNDTYANIGYMVPAPVIKHFLTDVEDGVIDGTPALGVSLQQMESPDIRNSFHMQADHSGVLVNRIYPGSPCEGFLRKGDVLLSIDGVTIENDGTVEFRKGERTFFSYGIQQKQLYESVSLAILRGGEEQVLSMQLTQAVGFDRLVPYRQYDIPPTYFIMGGLIFEPLTLNYLEGFGPKWNIVAPVEQMNFFLKGEPTQEQQEVIVLAKVLADEVNIGYHTSKNTIVSSVNGRKISRMKDLIEAFVSHAGKYHVVEDIHGFQIVLDKQSAEEALPRILRKYKIPSARSVNLQ